MGFRISFLGSKVLHLRLENFGDIVLGLKGKSGNIYRV